VENNALRKTHTPGAHLEATGIYILTTNFEILEVERKRGASDFGFGGVLVINLALMRNLSSRTTFAN